MLIKEIIDELEPLASPRTKKSHIKQGAKEPLFGLTVKSMKPLAKRLLKLENCQDIAYDLFDTGNYDLMYLAGMIVNPHIMSEEKYNDWLSKAYFYMITDYIIAISLSENENALDYADKWIESNDDLTISAGYHTYCWRIASQSDDIFDEESLREKLNHIMTIIKTASNRSRYAMYYFLNTIGVSYKPLHEEALIIAEAVGDIEVESYDGKITMYNAYESIKKQVDKKRIGFKRKNVRC